MIEIFNLIMFLALGVYAGLALYRGKNTEVLLCIIAWAGWEITLQLKIIIDILNTV